jgi:hypothetical protein
MPSVIQMSVSDEGSRSSGELSLLLASTSQLRIGPSSLTLLWMTCGWFALRDFSKSAQRHA